MPAAVHGRLHVTCCPSSVVPLVGLSVNAPGNIVTGATSRASVWSVVPSDAAPPAPVSQITVESVVAVLVAAAVVPVVVSDVTPVLAPRDTPIPVIVAGVVVLEAVPGDNVTSVVTADVAVGAPDDEEAPVAVSTDVKVLMVVSGSVTAAEVPSDGTSPVVSDAVASPQDVSKFVVPPVDVVG